MNVIGSVILYKTSASCVRAEAHSLREVVVVAWAQDGASSQLWGALGAEAAGDTSTSGSPALGLGQGSAWAVPDLPAHTLGVLWAV